jgi:hypothetical protein
MAVLRNACKTMIGKSKGKRPLGRNTHRWEDNIRMDLSEIQWEDVDWIHVAQDRDQWRVLVDTAMQIEFHKTQGFLD